MTRQSASHRQPYRFGDFLLDPACRELRRGDKPVTVWPKVFDCLTYLIEHRERAVGRDELIAAVWGRVDVADAQLKPLLRKVRRAIDDDGNDQAFIRTIPGFGFRWVAEIRSEEDSRLLERSAEPATASATLPSPDARNWTDAFSRRRIRAVLATFVFLIVVVVAGYMLDVRRSHVATAAVGGATVAHQSRNLVAVLPVRVMGDSGVDSAWMPLGLMDLIASRLREAKLAVVPSADMVALARAKGADADGGQAMGATGAGAAVSGTLEHSDADWRLRLELIDSDGARHTVEARSPDAIVATREGADRLADMLGGHSTVPSVDEAQKFELLQRIEAALLVDDFHSAQRLLDTATSEQRGTSDLQLAAARIEIGLGDIAAAQERLETLLASAPVEAAPLFRARILNYLGSVAYSLGDMDLAEKRFGQGLTLLESRDEPVLSGQAYARRGGLLVLQRRYDDADSDFARARTAFDLVGDTFGLAVVELNEGTMEAMRNRQTQALSLFEKAVRHSEAFGDRPHLVHALGNEISAYLELLRPADALVVSRRIDAELHGVDISPDLRVIRYQQVPALLKNGLLAEARKRVEELEGEPDRQEAEQLRGLAQESNVELDVAAHQWTNAADDAALAVAVLAPGRDDRFRGRAWLTLTRALRAQQRMTDAAAETGRFSQWAGSAKEGPAPIYADLAAAEQIAADKGAVAAYPIYEDALRAARGAGVPVDIAEVTVAYGNALIDAGDIARATTVVGQVAQWADVDFDCAVLQARLYRALGRTDAWNVAARQARMLAGERPIPDSIMESPVVLGLAEHR